MEDPADDNYADQALLKRWKAESMLEQAATLHDDMRRLDPANAGRDHLTFFQRPYAAEQSMGFVKKAPVWFTAYLPSLIADKRPLAALGDPELLRHLTELQVSGIHTGPVMLAGGYSAGYIGSSGDSATKVGLDGTADGWFDPIELAVDPKFGDEADYETLVEEATKKREILVVGDIVPGHTGRGRDFHLALRDFEHYSGVYLMARADETLDGYLAQTRVENNVRLFSKLKEDEKQRREISEVEFNALREEMAAPLPEGELSRFLSEDAISALTKLQIIPGMPQRTLGPQAGFGWSVTRDFLVEPPEGESDPRATKLRRRWVYLHFFDYRQPTLNWMDPSFAAWRMITGQLNYVVWKLGSGAVRLDANSFLGLEKIVETNLPEKSDDKLCTTWSEAHPLSKMATNMLSWQARRLGGFSFQEMNMGLQDYADAANVGPDLSYDFVTRPACEHALLTGNTEFLNIVYTEMAKYKVDPGRLVHALQNHDDLTFELVHFRDRGADELFDVGTEKMPGWTSKNAKIEEKNDKAERDRFDAQGDRDETRGSAAAMDAVAVTSVWRKVRSELRNKARNGNTFNAESGNGLCTTFAGLIAGGLGCRNLEEAKQKVGKICQGHLLLAAFNAWQPGVFAFSGWDVVGAFPVEHGPRGEETEEMRIVPEADGRPRKDYRWRNRGAYRLLDNGVEAAAYDPHKRYGCLDIQQAYPLYGALDAQMAAGSPEAGNFCKGLQEILRARGQHRIFAGEFGGVLDLGDPALFGMLTWFEDGSGAAIAIFNFDPLETKYAMIRPHRLQGWIDKRERKSPTNTNFARMKLRVNNDTSGTEVRIGKPFALVGWEYELLILSDEQAI